MILIESKIEIVQADLRVFVWCAMDGVDIPEGTF